MWLLATQAGSLARRCAVHDRFALYQQIIHYTHSMLALSPYRFDGVRSSENIIGLQDSGVNIAMKIILNFCDASETFEEFLSAATRWARLGSRLSRGLKY